MCTFLDTTPCQMTWNKIGLLAITRFLKKYFESKPNDDSQERMERQPLGLHQAQLQSMGLVEPLEGETFNDFGLQKYILEYPNIFRWPEGCNHDGKGHLGDCCSGNCDGFALGKNAEQYDWPGEIPVTEWLAGSYQVPIELG